MLSELRREEDMSTQRTSIHKQKSRMPCKRERGGESVILGKGFIVINDFHYSFFSSFGSILGHSSLARQDFSIGLLEVISEGCKT